MTRGITAAQQLGLVAAIGLAVGTIIGALIAANHYENDDKQLKIGIATGTQAAGIALKDFMLKTRSAGARPVTNWPAVVEFFADSFMVIGDRDRSNIINHGK